MMIRINRAHDGKVIEVKQALSQFNSIDDLLHAISLATAIPSDGIICMTGDGAQLNDELLATLSTEDQGQITEFFVFNRDFLYTDVDVLSQDLAVEPALAPAPSSIDLVQPPTPRSLEAIVAWSHSILEYVHSHASTSQHHHSALSTIQRSTSVALLNLLSHSHNVKDGSLSAKVSNEGQLGRMQRLLGGYQRDLEILGLVRVNPALLPPSSGSSSKRTLGDFVSRVKMGAVADACNRVFEELQSQQNELAGNSSQLEADTRDLTSEVEGTSIDPSTETLEEALQAETRAEELTAYLVDTCSPDSNGWPVADKLDGSTINEIQQAVEELYLLDEVARESVRRLTADKNDMTARCLSLLGDISSLQSDYADLSAGLAAFDTELKSGRVDGFRHLTRLNNMLWAYGATVIEIVRRREFTKYFLAKSQALAELMAKASSRERKRRNKYRTSIAGQLPWEVKGMDEAPPSLEISTSRSTETTPELDRQDLQGLLQLIGEIEDTLAKADAISGDSSGGPLARSKKDLQELIARLDNLDDEFAVLVEKNLLGLDEDWEGGSEDGNGSDSSDGDMIKKPTTRRVNNGSRAGDDILAITQKENERLQQENRDLNKQAEAREMSDHQRYQSELTALRSECSAARLENRRLKEELNSVTREKASAMSEVETLRGDVDLERERRLNMQEELSLLRKEAQAARKEEEQARREASEEAERLAEAELHVQDLQNELEEARAARIDASNRIESLLSEGSNVEKELSAAQEHIEDLLAQLGQARQDAREARDAHAEAEATKERLVRSHRAEADGDRAILEENLREHRSELETARAELERIKDTTKAEVEAAQTLRGQLRGADEAHEELVKTMEAAKDASAEAELAMRHAERESEQLNELVRPMLLSLLSLQSHIRALPVLSSSRSASASTPGPIEENKQIGVAEEEDDEEANEAEAARQAALQDFVAAGGEANAATTLAALRALSGQGLCQEVTKKLDVLVTLVRKWQKTYKRHTADSNAKLTAAIGNRIAFRNFQVGDLALFLPSRNNTLDPKPWAAFNISFPHFFLNAPAKSVLAEQLRSKEWIVARIVKIIERVTDTREGGGNPFQLVDGTRFCLLDVDGWNPNGTSGVAVRPAMPPNKQRTSSVGFKTPGDESAANTAEPVLRDKEAASRQAGEQAQSASPEKEGSTVAASAQDIGVSSNPPETPEASVADVDSLVSPEATLEVRRPSNATELTSQNGFSPGRFAQIAPSTNALASSERGTLASSPSALTRAIRAAASRSPSTSRARERISTPTNGTSAEPGSALHLTSNKRPGTLSTSHEAVSKSHVSVDSSMSTSTAPAFGIRGRRRGLRGGGGNIGGIASAATSPGATASASRAIESTLAAAGNPFSQSPGGPFATSLPRAAASSNGDDRQQTGISASTVESAAVVPVDSAKEVPPAMSSPRRRSPSSMSTATRRPNSLNFATGSPTAMASGVPANAEASLAQAIGVNSGSYKDTSNGSKRPGLATSPLAQGTGGLAAKSPPTPSARSPSFLLGAFGRKGSNTKGTVSSLFGSSADKNGEAPNASSPSSLRIPRKVTGFQGGNLDGSASASDLLRRLSDGMGGGSGQK